MYHGKKETSILSMLISAICALVLIVGVTLGVVVMTSCATTPEPKQVQVQPEKPKSTLMQTFIQFFEPRD